MLSLLCSETKNMARINSGTKFITIAGTSKITKASTEVQP